VSSQTLDKAIIITLKNNPELHHSFDLYQSSLQEINAAKGAYLPNIDLDAGIGYESINPAKTNSKEETDMDRREAFISLNQLIWDGSSTINNINRTSYEAESDRFQLLGDESDKSLEVTKAYLDVISLSKILVLSEENLKVHKNIFKDTERKTEAGFGSIADVSQVKARIAKAESNLLVAKNNMYNANTTFIRLVGEEPENLITPKISVKKIPQLMSEALAVAYKRNPTIKVARYDVLSANYQYKQSISPNYPTISFEVNHSIRQDAGGYEGKSDETTAMIRFRYNLYHGGTDGANIESYAYKVNQAKSLRESVLRQIKEGLTLSWNSYDLTRKELVFLKKHVNSVAETIISYNKQYLIGQRTLLDLLNSQNELFESKKDYINVKFKYKYSKYRILNAMGVLLETINMPSQ